MSDSGHRLKKKRENGKKLLRRRRRTRGKKKNDVLVTETRKTVVRMKRKVKKSMTMKRIDRQSPEGTCACAALLLVLAQALSC